ncbi:amino acid ABC transporter substrate-binding protein [Candidatus Persebacteraceae bacterium Df01]|jgi:general L-amino acid transport system substrate-binding protein|uniref:Amino acid ABC transporter substrate-binding protein n=1 Tax=Candidatus Doriopsillibacter californiensis TaxID=2970740 RepID=A0ABT7QKJ8_9GAMM|nr:amino acid ABC transporter substrate-binding protein [Candidatus Persebacteraceae bacterium Df01]
MKHETWQAWLAAGALVVSSGASAGTLEDVQNRGHVICGVDGGLPGFSAPDDAGKIRGIDADVCYAVAAAVLGDRESVKFVPLTAKERFTALSSGEIDVLSRNTTHTLTRDASLGLNFTYYNFIDGQAFMAKKDLGVNSAKELDGARVCVQSGTTTEINLADYFRSNKMDFELVAYETSVQTREGFEGGACDVLTSDKSQLAAIRSELADPSSAQVLPETISKEPLGPVVRQGDDAWFNTVKWTLWAMMNAEELGVSSANADQMRSSEDPSVLRLLGLEGDSCQLISDKLSKDCFYQAVKQVGNYGEIYEANVGENTPLGLTRAGSPNDLWSRGGLIYAPPVR